MRKDQKTNKSTSEILSELERTHAELHTVEERFLQMAESISDVFLLIELATGQMLYVSPAYEKIWGRSVESLYSNPESWVKSIHPEDRKRIIAKYMEQMQTGWFNEEYRIVRPHGEIRWIHGRTYPVYDKANRLIRSAGIVEDITERQHTEKALRESERRFIHMLHNVDLISLLLDSNANIIDCNDYLLHLTDWKREEIIGKNWFNLFIPDTQYKEMTQFFKKLIHNKAIASHYENDILTRHGERRLIHWNNSVLRSVTGEIIGTASIGEDITDHHKIEQERQKHVAAIIRGVEELVIALTKALEQRDPYTAGHQRRVANLSVAIAKELRLSEDQIHGLKLAAEIHDLGKIGIPISILSKPGHLTDLEYEMIKTHAETGYQILKNVHFPWPIAEIILQHHERLDGSGYPQGLKGEQIALESKILAVADVVEAMTSHRPYRSALGLEAALIELDKGRGILFDENAVDACKKLLQEKRFQFEPNVT